MCVPKIMLAPFTDTTLFPPFDISLAPVTSFCLGFIVSDTDGDPSWGGYHKIKSDFYLDKIKAVRKRGGDVIVSFGGAAGVEIATNTFDVTKLYEKYASVVKRYNLEAIDLDIEGPALYDRAACVRRGKALDLLRNVYPNLQVSVTLPAMPYGLGKPALLCLTETPHDIVNIMAMNFGNEKDMGKAVISAIKATRSQTKKKIGVTVMIGKNDTPEVFRLADARTLKNFVDKNKYVVWVSFWAIERDQGLPGGLAQSSQIVQKKWEFTNILKS